ncbi:MAG: helix-turn-helix domain-containing protein [Natronosporangium sp.]
MTERIAAEAQRLRTEEGLSAQQIQHRLGVSKLRLYEWLRGVPPPEWTRRPNAKDDLRERALGLRSDGWSVNDIALELGVAKSTAYQWVRHHPLDGASERARAKRERQRQFMTARWDAFRREQDERRAEVHAIAEARVGRLGERDLLLLAAAIYWSEGAKAKPWRREYKVVLINSDLVLLAAFLDFLGSAGIDRSALKYRVSIHETADPQAAVSWWAASLGLPLDRFYASSIKRHTPRTNRRNTGSDYHGCLTIYLPRGREVYWLLEGVVKSVGRSVMGDLAEGTR